MSSAHCSACRHAHYHARHHHACMTAYLLCPVHMWWKCCWGMAKTKRHSTECNVCAPDTGLMIVSVAHPHAQVVRLLLEHGANANVGHAAPLAAAISARNAAVYELLVGGLCVTVCMHVCVAWVGGSTVPHRPTSHECLMRCMGRCLESCGLGCLCVCMCVSGGWGKAFVGITVFVL